MASRRVGACRSRLTVPWSNGVKRCLSKSSAANIIGMLTSSYSRTPSMPRAANASSSSALSFLCTRSLRTMKKRMAQDEFEVVSLPAISCVRAVRTESESQQVRSRGDVAHAYPRR